MSKKILIASVDALPNIGGISIMAHELANSLSKECDVDFYMKKSIKELPGGFNKLYNNIYGDDNIHAMKLDEYDHIICLHPHIFVKKFIKLKLKYNYKYKVSVFFHGFEYNSVINYPQKNTLKDQLLYLSNKKINRKKEIIWAINNVDYIFVNSDWTKNLILNDFPCKNIYVTGCGINLREIDNYTKLKKQTCRDDLSIPINDKVIGYIGRLVKSKNVDKLIEIFNLYYNKYNKNSYLYIIGDGPEKETLKELAKDLNIIDRVIFTGKVSEIDKWKYIKSFDLFCLLSRETDTGQVEGFGIVLLEALRMEVPVIGSNEGGIPFALGYIKQKEFIREPDLHKFQYQAPLIDLDDEKNYETFNKVLSDNKLSEGIVETGNYLIEKKYNWNIIAKNILKRLNEGIYDKE